MAYKLRKAQKKYGYRNRPLHRAVADGPVKPNDNKWDKRFSIIRRVELIMGLIAIPLVFIVGWNEIEAIAGQRSVNAWQVVTNRVPGNSGKIAALEFLNQQHYCVPFTNLCLLKKETLEFVDLSSVEDSRGSPKPVYLNGINLPDALLENVNMRGAILDNADLSGANLRHADLRGAILRHADLSGADLYRADLRGADLFRADFSSASIASADLTGTYLHSVDLTNTILILTDFTNAPLDVVDLSKVYGLELEQLSRACLYIAGNPPTLPDNEDFKDFKLKICPDK